MTKTSSIAAWILFFYIYCFLGWCVESSYVSFFQKKWVNRGFMRGPYIPLYGTGALMVTYVTLPVKQSIIMTFIIGSLAASVLEYVTGVLMEAIFKVRYWDYSEHKYNLNGHICLLNSIEWGFLSVFLVFVLDKPVAAIVNRFSEPVQFGTVILISLIFWSDFAMSVKAAFDVRDMLIKMTEVKEEINRLQRRLDVMIAVADDSFENWKEEKMDRMEDRLEILEKRLGLNEDFRKEMESIRERYLLTKKKESGLSWKFGIHKRGLLLNNPSARSSKFKEAFEELVARAEERRKQK